MKRGAPARIIGRAGARTGYPAFPDAPSTISTTWRSTLKERGGWGAWVMSIANAHAYHPAHQQCSPRRALGARPDLVRGALDGQPPPLDLRHLFCKRATFWCVRSGGGGGGRPKEPRKDRSAHNTPRAPQMLGAHHPAWTGRRLRSQTIPTPAAVSRERGACAGGGGTAGVRAALSCPQPAIHRLPRAAQAQTSPSRSPAPVSPNHPGPPRHLLSPVGAQLGNKRHSAQMRGVPGPPMKPAHSHPPTPHTPPPPRLE